MENDKTFMLVSLDDKESKDLAQVISNETSRKILDYLSKRKEATETKLAKELKLQLSTINYNVHNLMKAKLIESKEFAYSKKGKEINYYTLAKKFIIIAPKKSENILEQLKSLIPIGLITLGVSAVIYYISKLSNKVITSIQAFSEVLPVLPEEVKDRASENIGSGAMKIVQDAEPIQTIEAINKTTEVITKTQYVTNDALWFLMGAIFVIVLFILFILIKKRKK